VGGNAILISNSVMATSTPKVVKAPRCFSFVGTDGMLPTIKWLWKLTPPIFVLAAFIVFTMLRAAVLFALRN
jgi:hypothetical protein